jgi:hypothetical protein
MKPETCDKRPATLTIVYYGPPSSGKSTSVAQIHRCLDFAFPSEFVTLDSRDPDFCFDLLTCPLRASSGLPLLLKVYTIPRVTRFEETCGVLVDHADAIVFVADSQRARQKANVEAYSGLRLPRPVVLQFNKMDLSDAVPEEELRADWGTEGAPLYFSSALLEQGVMEPFCEAVRQACRKVDLPEELLSHCCSGEPERRRG